MLRRRGKSPRQAAFFVESPESNYQSAQRASLYLIFGLVDGAGAGLRPGFRIRPLDDGLLACRAYEAYLELHAPAIISFEYAWFLSLALGRRDEVTVARCEICGGEIQPEDPYALDNLGYLQLITGDATEALATYRKISAAALRDTGMAMAEYSLGHEQQSQQALEAAIAEGFASQIADVFAWRQQKDEAFAWLERAHEQHDGGLAERNTPAPSCSNWVRLPVARFHISRVSAASEEIARCFASWETASMEGSTSLNN
jgi:tetratricopeptide (TPR) repeat protein